MVRTVPSLAYTMWLLSGAMATATFPQRVSTSVENAGSFAIGGPTSASSQATESRSIAGTYRCGPDANACRWLGATITVAQSGTRLEIKSEKGETGQGELTSNLSVTAGAPWNMNGVISNDGRTIDWSNGTMWKRQ